MSEWTPMRIVAATRKYQDREGREKSAWVECGTLWVKGGVPASIELDALPAPQPAKDGRLVYRLSVFERDERPAAKPEASGQRTAAPSNAQDYDDDIPF